MRRVVTFLSVQRVRHTWLPAAALFVSLCLLALAQPTTAAPRYQTIVLPTPTPEVVVPTATPVPDRRDEIDESDSEPGTPGDVDVDESIGDGFESDGGDNEIGTDVSTDVGAGGVGIRLNSDNAASTAAEFYATISVDRVSLYAEPSTGATVIGTATRGEQFQVVGRNRAVTWYVLCCTDDGRPGWVNTRAIVRDFDLVDAIDLPVVADLSTLEVEMDPALVDDRPLGEIPVVELLAFTIEADPDVLTVGSRVEITYRLGNIGDHELTAIVVRNLLPAALEVEQIAIENGGYTLDEAGRELSLNWPVLPPGAVETAVVEATVSPAATQSTVIEYLATLATDEEVTTSAGVLLGLPPMAIPDFR